MKCPHCHHTDQQVKAGMNGRNQRYKCLYCERRYTPLPLPRGYPDDVRRKALELHARGVPLRAISQQLGMNPRSIANWVRNDGQDAPSESDDPSGGGARRRRATIEDVARRAGVSPSTVSNFLNGKGRMSQATRARVQNAIDHLHFSPNSLIRAIRQRRTNILGVLTFGINGLEGDVAGALTPGLLQGISDSAWKHGQEILVYTGWPHVRERYTSTIFLSGHVDGLIWIAPQMGEPILESVAHAQLPVMSIMSTAVPDGVGYVSCDNAGASRALTEHLIGLGHRRIAFLGPMTTSDFIERRDGYRAALDAAGLGADEALEATHDWPFAPYIRTIAGWLRMANPPTAIVTADDGYARDTIETCRGHGLRVPEDIAVTGFNGVVGANGAFANFTTARQPLREMGARAVDLLIALMEGAPVAECRAVIRPQIVIGATTVSDRTMARAAAS